MRKKNTIILLFIIITLTLGYLFYLSFIFTKNRCCRKIDQLFIKTIQIDQNKRNEETNTSYSIGSSIAITTDKSASNQRSSSKKYIIKNDYKTVIPNPDSLKHIYQTLLYHINPIKVTSLDSIFNSQLKSNKLNAKTAVRYTDNITHKSIVSLDDSSFIKTAYTTGIIKYGVHGEISLEAFVDLPVLLVLKAGKEKLFFILILWILTAVGFILGMKKTKQSRLTLNLDSVVKAEKTLIINESNININDAIYLNTNKFLLVRNESSIPLTELLCKVLTLFLKRPNQNIPYDEIINEIWGEIEVKGQERLTQTIKRLRNNLADCPEITIENVRGHGYKLIIKA